MEISGFLGAIVVGLIIGSLARLVLPGKQDIPLWLTILIGAVGAIIGTFAASILHVANTRGIDWIELGLQVAVAALGISMLAGSRGRRGINR